eukprot:Nitzschia sp. Nitz4//scaffold201_size42423//7260//8360//NITZ4_007368-RA/size42423-processed-gene-0.10-mRNA-1//1//CDS//3329541314//5558//frame0
MKDFLLKRFVMTIALCILSVSCLLSYYQDGSVSCRHSEPIWIIHPEEKHPQQPHSSSSQSVYSPWIHSTIIATIAMGNATQTHLVQRLLHSLQSNGGWEHGRIAILTDHPEIFRSHYHVGSDMHLSEKIIVLEAKQNDLFPPAANGGAGLATFKREAMRYKRFKTLLLEYLDEYYRASDPKQISYRFVVYMDVDIVVARPIAPLLQDYQDQMIRKGVFASALSDHPRPSSGDEAESNKRDLPFMSMFSDCPTCARKNTNSGVIILHRQRSRECLEEWNQLLLQGADWGVYDQRFLRDIRANGKCKIHTLPDFHRLYPTWKDMRLLLSATIVHNTNSYNAQKIPPQVQASYFSYLLNSTEYTSLEVF